MTTSATPRPARERRPATTHAPARSTASCPGSQPERRRGRPGPGRRGRPACRRRAARRTPRLAGGGGDRSRGTRRRAGRAGRRRDRARRGAAARRGGPHRRPAALLRRRGVPRAPTSAPPWTARRRPPARWPGCNVPLGPVAVFGASNFPLAFSVLGNDTGSALAAGCPVVAKAHPAHPLLSRRVADLADDALAAAGAPDGTFSLVVGFDAGTGLVQAEQVEAVAFTGSEAGGMALWRLANARPRVIPVFAEMGTVNPVVVTPAAAGAHRGDRRRVRRAPSRSERASSAPSRDCCSRPAVGGRARGGRARPCVEAAPGDEHADPADRHRRTARCRGAAPRGRPRGRPGARHRPGLVGRRRRAQRAARRAQPGSRLLEECFGPVAVVVEYDDLDDVLAAARPTCPAPSPRPSSRGRRRRPRGRPAAGARCPATSAGSRSTTGPPARPRCGRSSTADRGRPPPTRPRPRSAPPRWTGSCVR